MKEKKKGGPHPVLRPEKKLPHQPPNERKPLETFRQRQDTGEHVRYHRIRRIRLRLLETGTIFRKNVGSIV